MMGVVPCINWENRRGHSGLHHHRSHALHVQHRHGHRLGFISYVLIKVLSGKWDEVPWLTYLLAVLFILRFVFL